MENIKKSSSQNYIWGVFLAVLVVHFLLFSVWQKRFFVFFFINCHIFMDALSWAYQDIVYFHHSFQIFSPFRHGAMGYWPPVAPLISFWALRVLPAPWFFLPNFFYLAAIMLGIYFSTMYLSGDRFYSMLAAVIFSCYWIVMVQLAAFEVQLAAVTCIVWSFYGYLRSCFFTRFWPSMAVGLFMALGLYCDHLTPGLFVLALFLVPENFRTKKAWSLMTLVLGAVTVCVWPFYSRWMWGPLHNTTVFFSQLGDFAPPLEAYRKVLHNPQFLWAHLSYYFISLPEKLLGYGFTGLLILGMFFLHRVKRPYPKVFGIVLLIPLTVFTSIIKKDFAYIFPLCIYFAMISGMGISFIRWKWFRHLLILLIIVLTTWQYVLLFDLSDQAHEHSLFSHQFTRMNERKIPRLILYEYPFFRGNVTGRLRSLLGQVSAVVDKRASLGDQHPGMIIDLWDDCLQHAAVFYLRLNMRKIKIINGFFLMESDNYKECTDISYLLSDRKKYAEKTATGFGEACSWTHLEPLYRFPDSGITLYRVER